MVKEPVARRIPLEPGADRARDLAVAQLLSVPVARIEEVELVSAGHVVVGATVSPSGTPAGSRSSGRGEFAEHVGVVSVRHPIANGERITFKVSRPCKRIYGYVLYCGVCNRTSVRRTSALEPPPRAVFGIASIGTLSGAVSLPEIAAPVLGVASLLMLGTAATGVCGLYALLGVDTCPVSAVDSR